MLETYVYFEKLNLRPEKTDKYICQNNVTYVGRKHSQLAWWNPNQGILVESLY